MQATCLCTWWLRCGDLCEGVVDVDGVMLTVVGWQVVLFIDFVAQLLKLIQEVLAAVEYSSAGGNWRSVSERAVPLAQLCLVLWVCEVLQREPRLPRITV